MTIQNCLNCESDLTDQFCSRCGQKADTHRISFKNFILHDVLHGTFHIEKGMLFTAKQAIVRPGKAALDYIAGKRKRYYNVFYLILLTAGYTLFIRHLYQVLEISQGVDMVEPQYLNETSKTINQKIAEYSKYVILLFLPLAAVNSFILFRRNRLNLSEHFIIAGMVLLGMLLISATGHTLFYFNLVVDSEMIVWTINNLTPAAVVLQIAYAYYNAFNTFYSKIGISYRIMLFFGLFLLELYGLLYLLVGLITGWNFSGTIRLNPFQ